MATRTDATDPNDAYRYVGALGYYADADDEHGLLLLGARYYRPSIGRFITLDPIKDGSNWYVYVGNGPVNRVDPRGTEPCAGKITNKRCIAACKVLYPNPESKRYKECVWICTHLKGKSCNQLWAFCKHLARIGKKSLSQRCFTLYISLCGGE